MILILIPFGVSLSKRLFCHVYTRLERRQWKRIWRKYSQRHKPIKSKHIAVAVLHNKSPECKYSRKKREILWQNGRNTGEKIMRLCKKGIEREQKGTTQKKNILAVFGLWSAISIYQTVAIKKRLKCFIAKHCVTLCLLVSLSWRSNFLQLLCYFAITLANNRAAIRKIQSKLARGIAMTMTTMTMTSNVSFKQCSNNL